MAASRTLSTAEERREEILEAAERVFAARGLHGTPTMEIAKAAGISQAYLFRLFPTKAELFMALVERCNARIERTFADAAAAARAAGEPVMQAMGDGVRRAARRSQPAAQPAARARRLRRPRDPRPDAARLRSASSSSSSARPAPTPQEVRDFFAHGMLLNVLAAMQAQDVDAHWAAGPAQAPARTTTAADRPLFFACVVSD